jgi:hypothetical protein
MKKHLKIKTFCSIKKKEMSIEMKLITFGWMEHSFMIGKRRRHGSRKIQRWSQGGGKGLL